MTSSVSIVSDFVANGHQIIPNDSCSPSKIPYGGFSPVRLQTEIPPRPSSTPPELKRKTRIPSGHVSGVLNQDLFRPEALGSPEGYAVPPDPCLLWPHVKLSELPAGLSASPRQVFALRSGRSQPREAPQFTPRIFLTVPPSVPRQTGWPPMTVSSPSALAFATSAPARHLRFPPPPVLGWPCNGAATFALCYGPLSCSLFTGKSFYFRAYTPWSHPHGTSSITIRPNSQLPEPDFHRQDTQHYGLRTENTEKRFNINRLRETLFPPSVPSTVSYLPTEKSENKPKAKNQLNPILFCVLLPSIHNRKYLTIGNS
jgi:hypothetical protein